MLLSAQDSIEDLKTTHLFRQRPTFGYHRCKKVDFYYSREIYLVVDASSFVPSSPDSSLRSNPCPTTLFMPSRGGLMSRRFREKVMMESSDTEATIGIKSHIKYDHTAVTMKTEFKVRFSFKS